MSSPKRKQRRWCARAWIPSRRDPAAQHYCGRLADWSDIELQDDVLAAEDLRARFVAHGSRLPGCGAGHCSGGLCGGVGSATRCLTRRRWAARCISARGPRAAPPLRRLRSAPGSTSTGRSRALLTPSSFLRLCGRCCLRRCGARSAACWWMAGRTATTLRCACSSIPPTPSAFFPLPAFARRTCSNTWIACSTIVSPASGDANPSLHNEPAAFLSAIARPQCNGRQSSR